MLIRKSNIGEVLLIDLCRYRSAQCDKYCSLFRGSARIAATQSRIRLAPNSPSCVGWLMEKTPIRFRPTEHFFFNQQFSWNRDHGSPVSRRMACPSFDWYRKSMWKEFLIKTKYFFLFSSRQKNRAARATQRGDRFHRLLWSLLIVISEKLYFFYKLKSVWRDRQRRRKWKSVRFIHFWIGILFAFALVAGWFPSDKICPLLVYIFAQVTGNYNVTSFSTPLLLLLLLWLLLFSFHLKDWYQRR